MRKTAAFMLGLTAFGLIACSGESSNRAHSSETGIVISAPYIAPPLPGRDIAVAYMDIANHGDADDRLLAVSSPISAVIEIHSNVKENGVMKMRRENEGLVLPAGETIVLEQGGFHLMMFGVTLDDEHIDAALTLDFETAEDVTLIVPIKGRSD